TVRPAHVPPFSLHSSPPPPAPHSFPTRRSSDLDHREPRRVDWATGCALFLAAPTFRRLGPIDEDYFLYLEDTDWCLRAARLGVETWLIPGAVIRHEVSASVRALPQAAVRYYAYRNQYRLEFRHGPAWLRPLVLLDALWTLSKAA